MKRTILAVALAALTLGAAGSAQAKHLDGQRLVVRGTDTVLDHPCPGGLCIEQTGASFRGTLGTGAYTGSMKLDLANAFPNGEGGVCAPVAGRITLGAGTPDRLDLAVWGDSCQDGAGDPTNRRSPAWPTSPSCTAPAPTRRPGARDRDVPGGRQRPRAAHADRADRPVLSPCCAARWRCR